MQAMVKYAKSASDRVPGYDYRYFTNVSNILFLKAEAGGLQSRESMNYFHMSCWLAMCAAEVDTFAYVKYDKLSRAQYRDAFYQKYIDPALVWLPASEDDPALEIFLGEYSIESCRFDLIPSVALERLGIHNELCVLKFANPVEWMRSGFVVSARIDSMKRHFEAIHTSQLNEDHLAHLIWGFMAITHVVTVHPQCNDLIDFESIRTSNNAALTEAQLQD